ncbi:MAG: Crp/Fnr family transcriptional regulator [Xanthobacteraceae bacterium]|nr:Crp/Fnr family transcriptional regulator [Xanthobacteraceae bacterium]
MRSFEDLLLASPWTQGLTSEHLKRVRTTTIVRDFAAEAHVCHAGDPANVWVGVVEGLVRMVSMSSSGKSMTFAALPSGSWFGEGSVLKREIRKHSAIAVRPSRVALMPDATFFWLLDSSIAFNRFLLVQLNERLGHFMSIVEHDRLLEPDARVARSLAAMFNPQLYPGTKHQIELSQEELGHIVGASRQRISQALQVLDKAGLIKVDYRMITVLDLEGLRRFGD